MNETSSSIPPTLNEAMGTEPMWLQVWVTVLALSVLASALFVVARTDGRWHVRGESVAILVSFAASSIIMTWMYEQYGYVRLLGLAHIVAWAPAYAYVLMRRREIGTSSLFGKYIHLYLVVAGISLVIDSVDVVRHLLGDGELYLRWAT